MDNLEAIGKSGSETPETDALKSGTTFLGDRFHITTPVDDGDWDVVWVAHDQVRHSEETLKYLLDCSRMEEDELSLFCEDTKWALFQKHPNIVRVFKLSQPSRASKIAEKLVETPPVNSNAHLENPFFEVSDIQSWIRILCEAMRRYHLERSSREKEEGPTPGNHHQALEREPASPHDLSVSSRVAATMKRLTGSPTVFTTSYGSPEQALGQPLDEKQDVYAVGALIYDLLTGRPPFFAGDVMTQVYRVTPPAMSERRRQFGFREAP